MGHRDGMALNPGDGDRGFRWPQRRLLPLHLLLAALTVGLLVWAGAGRGWYAVGAGLAGLAFGAAWAALLRATARTPRRPVPAAPDQDGTTVLRGSPMTAALLAAAWIAGMAAAAAWVTALVVEFDSGPSSRGFIVVLALCALASLPNFLRLLAGKLRLWRLELRPDRLDYLDTRRAHSATWSEISNIAVDRRRSEIVAERGDGAAAIRIPLVLFDAPPDQIIELVESHRSGRPPERPRPSSAG
jgi:hypothetical protein